MPKSFNLRGGKPNRIGEFTRRTGAPYLFENLVHATMHDLEWKNEGILGPLSPGEIESNSLWRGLTGKGRSRAGLNWRLPKLPSRRANPIGRAITGKLHIPGEVVRPRSNVIHGIIEGMSHSGIAKFMRRALTTFGSAHRGIMKLLPGQVLEKVSQAFSKLTGGRIKNILEMGEESFLKAVKSGEAGIAFKERESLWTDWSLVTMRNAQKERNALLPGLQTWEEAATDTLPERKFFAYNTAIGTKAGEGLRTVGAASMYRSPTGEWIRGGLTVAEEFRGKGPRGLGATLSRALFEQGAVIPDTLSTSGAKAYYRQVSAMRDEVLAMENLTRAQSEFTVPGVSANLNKERGIRRGPNGGNG